MTTEQFDSWAYQKVKDFLLTDATVAAEEKRGFDRVRAFLAGLESDREALVTK